MPEICDPILASELTNTTLKNLPENDCLPLIDSTSRLITLKRSRQYLEIILVQVFTRESWHLRCDMKVFANALCKAVDELRAKHRSLSIPQLHKLKGSIGVRFSFRIGFTTSAEEVVGKARYVMHLVWRDACLITGIRANSVLLLDNRCVDIPEFECVTKKLKKEGYHIYMMKEDCCFVEQGLQEITDYLCSTMFTIIMNTGASDRVFWFPKHSLMVHTVACVIQEYGKQGLWKFDETTFSKHWKLFEYKPSEMASTIESAIRWAHESSHNLDRQSFLTETALRSVKDVCVEPANIAASRP